MLTGLIWVVFYWLIVQHGGGSVWCPTGIAFVLGFAVLMLALYRGWEEPLAKEPAGVYKHGDGRPMLGRKIAGKSQRELRDLGLLVETEHSNQRSPNRSRYAPHDRGRPARSPDPHDFERRPLRLHSAEVVGPAVCGASAA